MRERKILTNGSNETFPQALAPVQSRMPFLPSISMSGEQPVPAPPTSWASLGTKESTICSCRGCLPFPCNEYAEQGSSFHLPAALNADDVVFNHHWPAIVMRSGHLRKRQKTVKLGTNIAGESHRSVKCEYLVQQVLDDINFPILSDFPQDDSQDAPTRRTNNERMKVANMEIHV